MLSFKKFGPKNILFIMIDEHYYFVFIIFLIIISKMHVCKYRIILVSVSKFC